MLSLDLFVSFGAPPHAVVTLLITRNGEPYIKRLMRDSHFNDEKKRLVKFIVEQFYYVTAEKKSCYPKMSSHKRQPCNMYT